MSWRTCAVWGEGRYRATVVDSEQYLLTLMRYIELNPVRAGMVAHLRDYPWSSYAFNALGVAGHNSKWLTPHEQYFRLGQNEEERLSAYRHLFQAALSEQDLNAIRDSTHKGWALGSLRFREQIEALTHRQSSSKGVGRPRNDDNRV